MINVNIRNDADRIYYRYMHLFVQDDDKKQIWYTAFLLIGIINLTYHTVTAIDIYNESIMNQVFIYVITVSRIIQSFSLIDDIAIQINKQK